MRDEFENNFGRHRCRRRRSVSKIEYALNMSEMHIKRKQIKWCRRTHSIGRCARFDWYVKWNRCKSKITRSRQMRANANALAGSLNAFSLLRLSLSHDVRTGTWAGQRLENGFWVKKVCIKEIWKKVTNGTWWWLQLCSQHMCGISRYSLVNWRISSVNIKNGLFIASVRDANWLAVVMVAAAFAALLLLLHNFVMPKAVDVPPIACVRGWNNDAVTTDGSAMIARSIACDFPNKSRLIDAIGWINDAVTDCGARAPPIEVNGNAAEPVANALPPLIGFRSLFAAPAGIVLNTDAVTVFGLAFCATRLNNSSGNSLTTDSVVASTVLAPIDFWMSFNSCEPNSNFTRDNCCLFGLNRLTLLGCCCCFCCFDEVSCNFNFSLCDNAL